MNDMAEARYLAIDLGAESGRALVGTLQDGVLIQKEICRFANEPVEILGTLHWDILSIFNNILKALQAYRREFGRTVDSVGIDTWGVDFGLLAKDGSLLQNPVHYRDRRTEGVLPEIERRIPAPALFRITGMSLATIHSLCQLHAMHMAKSPVLETAALLLMMPDLLGYFLTGSKVCERTNAVNTQLYDISAGTWSGEVLDRFGLPPSLLPDLVNPASIIGKMKASVAARADMDPAMVVAPCTHDTAAAVAAIPASGGDWAFISCGTWSVVGAPTGSPVLSDAAHAAGFCNELAIGGPFLCSNITGLWLLQQVRAAWSRSGKSYSYLELVELAKAAPDGGALIDPEHPLFVAPHDMVAAIQGYCRRTGQQVPDGASDMSRLVVESLALCYRRTLERLAESLGRTFDVIHIAGGGSRNDLLCRYTANAANLPVVAGPTEATAAGNLLSQAMAFGKLSSAKEIREVVRKSTQLAEYEPRDQGYWQDRYEVFRQITQSQA